MKLSQLLLFSSIGISLAGCGINEPDRGKIKKFGVYECKTDTISHCLLPSLRGNQISAQEAPLDRPFQVWAWYDAGDVMEWRWIRPGQTKGVLDSNRYGGFRNDSSHMSINLSLTKQLKEWYVVRFVIPGGKYPVDEDSAKFVIPLQNLVARKEAGDSSVDLESDTLAFRVGSYGFSRIK